MIEGENYRNVLEAFEKKQELDFLDEKTQVSFSISPEAIEYLPEVTFEDLKMQKERYRSLLGMWESKGISAAQVNIKAILEIPDNPHYYTEGTNEITLNLPAVKSFVEQIKAADPASRHMEFLGDIHTHPVTLDKLNSHQRPSDCSDGDIEDVVKSYETGVISSKNPFIFAVAGLNEARETEYSFYRVIRKENTKGEHIYKTIRINQDL